MYQLYFLSLKPRCLSHLCTYTGTISAKSKSAVSYSSITLQVLILALGDRPPGYPTGKITSSYSAEITGNDLGSGTNDPQIWLVGLDPSLLGKTAQIVIDSDGLTGYTSASRTVSESSKILLPDGRYLDGNRVYVSLVNRLNYPVENRKNGTYHITVICESKKYNYIITYNVR